MAELILVLVALALLVGFFFLVASETRRGARLCAPARVRLDELVLQVEFVFAHVDLGAFARNELVALAHRIGHDAVHLTLRAVRAAERLLTRVVRWLRSRQEVVEAPRETTREFVRTLSDFKETLEAVHPEIQQVDEVKKEGKQTPG